MTPPLIEPGAGPPNPYAPPKAEGLGDAVEPVRGTETFAWIALAGPAVAGVSSLVLIRIDPIIALVVATACLVTTLVMMAMDARRLRSKSTASWVVGAVMLFAVVFPLYMHRRARWGAPSRLPHALVSMAIYLFGNLYPGMAHEPAKVRIACTPSGPHRADGADCSAVQESGNDATSTCFDVILTCADQEAWREHACLTTSPGNPGQSHVTPEYPTDCGHPKLRVLETKVTAR